MKVLLLSPPTHFKKPSMAPLGICYISAYLNQRGIEAKAYDCFDVKFSDVEKLIKKENPDVVGISCFTNLRPEAKKIAEISKNLNSNVKVVMGGSHPNALPDQVLKYYSTDFVIHGEGELIMYNLVKNLDKPQKVNGISFLKDDRTITTKPESFIMDLDKIPFPDISNVINKSYTPVIFRRGRETIKIKKKIFSMNTSRGCPFNCQFCSTPKFWGRKWRAFSQKKVIDEMKFLHDEYDVEHIYFSDDTFTINEKRTIKLCDAIKNLDMTYNCETRVNCVSKEILKKLKDSGCILLKYGVESASPKILKNINKMITVKQILRAFKLTKEVDIPTEAFLMVGNPGENNKSIGETIDVLKKIRPDGMFCALALVYPGTGLYELAKRQGFINDSFWLTEKDPPVYTVENNILKLRYFQYRIVSELMKTRSSKEYIKFLLNRLTSPWRYFQRKKY